MPSLSRSFHAFGRRLPPLNFITIHYLYFIITCLASALIFWGSSTPFGSISFTDALFLAVSAMTEAGLNTVNLSALNTWQQVILFILIMLGSGIWVSAFVVFVRLRAFEQKFEDVEKRRGRRIRRVKTWASEKIGRGGTRGDDVEGGLDMEKDGAEDDKEKAEVDEEQDTLSRALTPPERRGGPEMNDAASGDDIPSPAPGITFRDDTRFTPSQPLHATSISTTATNINSLPPLNRRRHRSFISMSGVGARPVAASLHPVSTTSLPPLAPRTQTTSKHGDVSKYFSSAAGWISRNSQFHNLSEAERSELGGLEYRAVEFLAYLVPLYFILFQLLGALGCGAWVMVNMPETARANGLNPFWVGAFNAISAFNNSGMSLLDANMVAFQRSYYMLLTMSLLILAGNTAYPLFLRAIVWTLYKISQSLSRRELEANGIWTERTNTLRFLLDHPRRCYTHLFPSQHTWWLAFSVFSLNGMDWFFFEILNINNPSLNNNLATRYRVIDGLFQAFAVRSGGFYVVTISSLEIGLLVLYVVMMYISVYPVVITMRNSNVYEERSLGIYAEEEEPENSEQINATTADMDQEKQSKPSPLLKRAQTLRNHLAPTTSSPAAESNSSFIAHQLRAQLAHDAFFVFLALFLTMIVESSAFNRDPAVFSVFNFLFEIVSAYGCVGISIGVPYAAYSFSGAWRTLAKLILCVVMLRGRHRGLPVAIDKAVLLPGEKRAEEEEQDGALRRAKTELLRS